MQPERPMHAIFLYLKTIYADLMNETEGGNNQREDRLFLIEGGNQKLKTGCLEIAGVKKEEIRKSYFG